VGFQIFHLFYLTGLFMGVIHYSKKRNYFNSYYFFFYFKSYLNIYNNIIYKYHFPTSFNCVFLNNYYLNLSKFHSNIDTLLLLFIKNIFDSAIYTNFLFLSKIKYNKNNSLVISSNNFLSFLLLSSP
jgi:hypothetical protein